MFTKAFLDALVQGTPSQQEHLTLRDVRDVAADFLSEIPNAPKPEVHSPDQSDGDVADIPFFPNPRIEEERRRRAEEEKRRRVEEEQARKEEKERLRRIEMERIRRTEERARQAEERRGYQAQEVHLQKIEERSPKMQHPEPAAPPSSFIGPNVSVPSSTQPGDPFVVAPLSLPAPSLLPVIAESEVTTQLPPKRHVSRRKVLAGLAVAGVVVAGGGITWWMLTPHPLYTYHGHSSDVECVVWSPDGKRIASAGDKMVMVWDATDGGNVYTYRGHSSDESHVYSIAWSPDGKRIASAGSTVQVWDATNGGNVYTYRGHSDSVNAVAWSPDGKRIASASDDKTVQVWQVT